MSGDLTVSQNGWLGRRTAVSCSFFRRRPEVVTEQLEVHPFTGHAGARANLNRACRQHAQEHGFTHYAMPDHAARDGSWLVWGAPSHGGLLLERLPTRDAAEMWMVHRA